jgi:zinc transport system permease protein
VSFDEEFGEIIGVPVETVFLILLALTALAVVTLIRVVGVILAIALLTIPAAIGRQWTDGLLRMMVIAVLVCAVCTSSGLFLSYGLSDAFGISAPPGPLIILLAALLFGVSSAARAIAGRR